MTTQLLQNSLSQGGVYAILVTALIICILIEGIALPIILFKEKKEEGGTDNEAMDYAFAGPNLNNFRAIKNWFVNKCKKDK